MHLPSSEQLPQGNIHDLLSNQIMHRRRGMQAIRPEVLVPGNTARGVEKIGIDITVVSVSPPHPTVQ